MLARPVFIVGCGRSGTTILGRTLGEHPSLAFVNEPRALWARAYPVTDIWSRDAAARGARIALSAADADPRRTQALAELFEAEVRRIGRETLVEKLPINAFRLGLIHAMFPDARVIYIWRNGLEVARSIENKCNQGRWIASNPYKWHLLAALAHVRPQTALLPAACTSFYAKGLLEWRLSVDASLDFLGDARFAWCHLSYADLVDRPLMTIERILAFLGLSPDAAVEQFVTAHVRRRGVAEQRDLTELEATIGGARLKRSLGSELVAAG